MENILKSEKLYQREKKATERYHPAGLKNKISGPRIKQPAPRHDCSPHGETTYRQAKVPGFLSSWLNSGFQSTPNSLICFRLTDKTMARCLCDNQSRKNPGL